MLFSVNTNKFKKDKRPLNMHPVDWVGRVTRTNLALGSHKKFQPNFKDGKRQKILERVLA